MRSVNSRDLIDRRRHIALRRILQSEFRNPNSPRSGISLVEILISMFVLLFGLMGVASIFPVGNHYVVEGEKFDLGGNLAQNAFEELKARGMLRPEAWLYAGNASNPQGKSNRQFIQSSLPLPLDPSPGLFKEPLVATGVNQAGPGHAFVIDPMGAANFVDWRFPFGALNSPLNGDNPWFASTVPLSGDKWPVRRLTLPQAGGSPFTTPVAETIFRLRDDLVTVQPEEDDKPSIQSWDLNGGALLRRQYKGDYSWLATVVPTSGTTLAALQPNEVGYGDYSYDVSVVVFRKRDTTPSANSERLIEAEFLNSGELAIYSPTDVIADVDAAFDEVRPGNWIAVMGVNQTTGDFMLKWYRILSRDKETGDVSLSGSPPPVKQGRYVMLDGPDWPANSYTDLRAVLLPGAISVVTKQMKME